jgi:hypothetical protein
MKLIGFIGDGKIAKFHRAAIAHFDADIIRVFDPKYSNKNPHSLNSDFFADLDYCVICSPSYLHYDHIKLALKYLPAGPEIICEKPAFLPWQPIIDDDRINVIMQMRNFSFYPQGKQTIEIQMIRDRNYMRKWQGNLYFSGGFIFNLFTHYIDLAINHRCRFIGRVLPKGKNIRRIGDFNLFDLDNQKLFNDEYQKIFSGNGTKPKDLFYLYWVMNQLIQQYGPGEMYQQIEFDGGKYGI